MAVRRDPRGIDPAYDELCDLGDAWFRHFGGDVRTAMMSADKRELWHLTARLVRALAHHFPVQVVVGAAGQGAMELAAEGIENALAGKRPAAWKGENRGFSAAQRRHIGVFTVYADLGAGGIIPDKDAEGTAIRILGIESKAWKKTWAKVPPAEFNIFDYEALLRHFGSSDWWSLWEPRLRHAAESSRPRSRRNFACTLSS